MPTQPLKGHKTPNDWSLTLFMAVPDVLCLHGCFGKDDLYHDVRNQRFPRRKRYRSEVSKAVYVAVV